MSQKSAGKPAFLTPSRFVLNVILRWMAFKQSEKLKTEISRSGRWACPRSLA